MQDVDSKEVLSEHLKLNGDLKTLPEIVWELEHRTQQRTQILKEALTKKDDDLQVTHEENWSLTNRVHNVTALLEQAQLENQKLLEGCTKVKMAVLCSD